MTTTIKLKNGTGVPTAGALVQGEPAFDLTNKRLYTENAGGTVIEVGTNPSTLSVTGSATVGSTLGVTGAAIFSSTVAGAFNGTLGATTPASVAATTGTFSGAVTAGGISTSKNVVDQFAAEFVNTAATSYGLYVKGGSAGQVALRVDNAAGAVLLSMAGDTGAATFGGTVTADGLTVDKTATISTSDYYASSTFSGVLKGAATNTKAALLLNSVTSSGQNAFASIHSEPVADYRASLIGTYTADGSGAGYFAINQFSPNASATQERLRIDSSGTLKSTVNGAVANLLLENDADTPYMAFTESGAAQFFIGESSIVGGGGGYDIYATSGQGISFFTNALRRVDIDTSGNLLVGGTTTPVLAGTGPTALSLQGLAPVIDFRPTTGDAHLLYASPDNSLVLYNQTDNREDLRVDGSGHLGLGVTPLSDLHIFSNTVDSTNGIRLEYNTGIAYYSRIKQHGNDTHIMADTGNTGGAMQFFVGTDDHTTGSDMKLDASGNLTVGASGVGGTKVFSIIGGEAGSSAQINLNSLGYSTYIYQYQNNLVFGKSAAEYGRFDASGNFLVGHSAQVLDSKVLSQFIGSTHNGIILNETADTANTTFAAFSVSGTAIGSVGRVGATSAVAYNTTSDERLKSNIANSDPVLEKIMQVQVRQYDWTEGNLHQDYGFIAQELAPVLSGIVTEGKEEADMWQLDYSRLTPALLKAIQEQQAIIESLTARIEALEGAK
jgi:hypothetical protein